jgi:DASS family divalent anion:Na+ symporter
MVTFLALLLVYTYSHYAFASATAHVGAMYPAFLGVAIAAGTPPLLGALVFGFFSNIMGGLTHYGFGPAPVLSTEAATWTSGPGGASGCCSAW